MLDGREPTGTETVRANTIMGILEFQLEAGSQGGLKAFEGIGFMLP